MVVGFMHRQVVCCCCCCCGNCCSSWVTHSGYFHCWERMYSHYSLLASSVFPLLAELNFTNFVFMHFLINNALYHVYHVLCCGQEYPDLGFLFFFFLQNTFHTSFRVVFPFQFSIKWCGRNNNTCTILINIKSDVESQNCGDKTDKLKSIIFLIAPIVSTQTLF